MGVAVEGKAAMPGEGAFEVMRANAEAIEAWLACDTQWRCLAGPTGALLWLGLDYSAVDVVLRRGKWADPDRLFADLQLMEGAALGEMNKGER